jgi:hypothetical protein
MIGDYMIKWMKEIIWQKAIYSALIFTVYAFIIRQIEVILTMKYYLIPEYFGLWNKQMMPSAGQPPINFMITSIVITFVTGLSLAVIYYYIHDLLPKQFLKRVFLFADLMIGTSFIFFTLPAYLLFNIPIMLLVSWFISTFIIQVMAAFTFVKILK